MVLNNFYALITIIINAQARPFEARGYYRFFYIFLVRIYMRTLKTMNNTEMLHVSFSVIKCCIGIHNIVCFI